MSTLSGLAVKGEKGKSKFQSLDINSLYRVSLGESLEPQQKTLPRKHGMQSLGKLPSARRPPANLPSLKSEHSGQDPAISLVPSGGAGWGSGGKTEGGGTGPPAGGVSSTSSASTQQPPAASATSTSQPTQQQQTSQQQQAPQQQQQQIQTPAAASTPASTSSSGVHPPPSSAASLVQQQQIQPPTTVQGNVGGGTTSVGPSAPGTAQAPPQDKLWSSLMSGGSGVEGGGPNAPSYLAHQSPLFQQEFPSLSNEPGKGVTPAQGDTQYGPGPSLRPQTEGSWMQGGMGRPGPGGGAGGPGSAPSGDVRVQPVPEQGGARSSLGPSGPPAAGMVPGAGQGGAQPQGSVPPQLRGIIPQFMYRGNFAGFPPNYQGPPGPSRAPRYPEGGPQHQQGGRQGPRYGPQQTSQAQRPVDEELFSRPIIKEEDLNKLDDIARDGGWATQDDIDYNQKLAFSDDESTHEEDSSAVAGSHHRSSHGQGHGPGQTDKTERDLNKDKDDRPREERGGRGVRGETPPQGQRPWQQQQTPLGAAQPPARVMMPPDFHRGVSGGPPFPGPMKITSMFPPGPAVGPSVPPTQAPPTRLLEDEELWRERRRQQSEDVALAVERAKQRKEEEEKRFKETREAAAKKLQQLEEKMGVASSQPERGGSVDSSREGKSPSPAMSATSVPETKPTKPSPTTQQPPHSPEQQPVSWAEEEKPQPIREQSRESRETTPAQTGLDFGSDYRNQHVQPQPPPQEQHGGGHFLERERERELRKERERDRHEPMPFSQKFSEDLPPRFAKQKQMMLRTNVTTNAAQPTAAPSQTPPPLLATPIQPPPGANFDQRWGGNMHFNNQSKGGMGRRRGQPDEAEEPGRPPSRDREALRQDNKRERHTPEQDRERYSRQGSREHGRRYYEDYRSNRGDQLRHQGPDVEGIDDEQWRGPSEGGEKFWDSHHYENKDKEGRDTLSRHDPFEEKTTPWGDGGSEWREGGGTKEWESRPQRPDSRDSKTSRDSRHSRDSDKALGNVEVEHKTRSTSSWAEATSHEQPQYDKEEKKEERMQRLGPKIEERRGSGTKPRHESKPEVKENVWGREERSLGSLIASKSWAEAVPDPDIQNAGLGLELPGSTRLSSLLTNGAKKDAFDSLDVKNDERLDDRRGTDRGRDGKGPRGRGGRQTRPEPRNNIGAGALGATWQEQQGFPVFQRAWARAGASGAPTTEGRGGGGPRRGGARLHPAPGAGRPATSAWEGDDSELSGDEVSASTESGKEEGSLAARRTRKAPRSPKHGSMSTKKDEKPKDSVKDKKPVSAIGEQRTDKPMRPVGTREGFAPRGEPSRRGRGGSRPRGGMGRGMDGYGPPAKSPFGPRDDKKSDKQDDEDSKTKLGGMVPLSSITANAAGRLGKPSPVPPRMQRTRGGDPERGNRRNRGGRGRGSSPGRSEGRGPLAKQNSSDQGEECWETTSENSDGENGKGSRSKLGAKKTSASVRSGLQSFPAPAAPPTSKAPGAEKKNGLGSNVRSPQTQSQQPRPPRQSGTPGGIVVGKKESENKQGDAELKKLRSDKEKSSALETLDLNTYAAVTMLDEQTQNSLEHDEYYPFDSTNGFHQVHNKKKGPPAPSQGSPGSLNPPLSSTPPSSQASGPPRGALPPDDRRAPGGPRGKVPPPPLVQPPQTTSPTSLMTQPPPLLKQSKPAYDRSRVSKLPPRLAKQKENNRLQKAAAASAMQQHHMGADILDMGQTMAMYSMKDAPTPMNAWEKPLTGGLRTASPLAILPPGTLDACGQLTEAPLSGGSSQRSSPSAASDMSKAANKLAREVLREANILDGNSPPVQTIIFENTNLKSDVSAKFGGGPLSRGHTTEDTAASTSSSLSSFSPSQAAAEAGSAEHLALAFKGEDGADIKLDFPFDSELSQLTGEDKSKMRAHHMNSASTVVSSASLSTGISAAELNLKIASVKKVWESMPTVLEHTEDPSGGGQTGGGGQPFSAPGFGPPGSDQSMDSSAYSKEQQVEDGSVLVSQDVAYSAGPHVPGATGSYTVAPGMSVVTSLGKNDIASSTSSNVCKVKPQQQAIMSTGPSPIGHPGPLSPPPFNSSTAQQGHMAYPPVGRSAGVENVSCWQPTLGGSATAQFGGISAIPSPPTVLFNTSQQMAAAAATQQGLYGAFHQLDGHQARSQYSQYPPFGMGQTSNYSQQSLYLQTAPPPPQSATTDMYPPSMSQFRLQANAPFGQSQHVTSNPSTVLISTSSNSLMSASVKPSSQQIGAIGSKAGGPYQTAAGLASAMPSAPPQPSQMYIQYEHPGLLNLNQSFMSSSQLVQRQGPVQSNVVPTIQPPTSYFSNSAGQTGYYQTGSSALQPPPGPPGPQLHQAANPYNMSGYAAQTGNTVGLQGFSSQMAAAAQYRNSGVPNSYLKSNVGAPGQADLGSRQLKSPSGGQPDMLGSVFSTGQIPSPKSRKQPPPQPSPTQGLPSHQKFGSYPSASQSAAMALQQQQQQNQARNQVNVGMRGGMGAQTNRYPNPIQRPPVGTYQPQQQSTQQQTQQQQSLPSSGMGSGMSGNSGSNNGPSSPAPRHRMPHHSQPPTSNPQAPRSTNSSKPFFQAPGGSPNIVKLDQSVGEKRAANGSEETNGVVPPSSTPSISVEPATSSPSVTKTTPQSEMKITSDSAPKEDKTPPATTSTIE